ncbi:hypothetical protein CBR_g22457 [Chara braunii]|uniref:Uncharacterized protein n=1 Tax=Chara braunii TaxID=69332 RepID=A0A388L2P5_CHABU|nr:hypothetical protein CBR_g22457 [Chara braunii]|eukprot:GBG76577.1 hypothetical protein CBR_g22457 [Chara braunii]
MQSKRNALIKQQQANAPHPLGESALSPYRDRQPPSVEEKMKYFRDLSVQITQRKEMHEKEKNAPHPLGGMMGGGNNCLNNEELMHKIDQARASYREELHRQMEDKRRLEELSKNGLHPLGAPTIGLMNEGQIKRKTKGEAVKAQTDYHQDLTKQGPC